MVPPEYTNGQKAQTLLSKAISLSSLGQDDSALLSAVSVTQARLDRDALSARVAQAQAAAALRRKSAAEAQLAHARATYSAMTGAIRQAVIYLYTSGPGGLTLSPRAGALAVYAQDYADSMLGPYGVLARSQALEQRRSTDVHLVREEARVAEAAAARAAKAVADETAQLARLHSELKSASAASITLTVRDHLALAGQAGERLISPNALQFDPKTPVPPPVSTTRIALTWAFAELGKQYVWGATGPDTFDCSGLTQFVWRAAGVSIPRVAADQYRWTIPVPLSQLLPGDLVFFGTTDIHHVGIYIGDGLMINAPHTGTVVQVSSIWWSDLAGFGRVHYPGTPVPPHSVPTPARPARPVVTPTAGPVPSQVKPPPGWKPKSGSSTPIRPTNTVGARQTQQNLRNALAAEQAIWTKTRSYDSSTTGMQALEPSLSWTNAAVSSEGGNTVQVTASGNQVELQAYAKDGKCYSILQDNGASGRQTGYAVKTSATGCAQPTLASQTIADGNAVDGGGFYQSW